MIKPLFDQQDDDWVWMVGRYILNMGAVEAATRLIVVQIAGTDAAPIFADGLSARIGFIRKRFPREPAQRHERVMNTLEVAAKHAGFRNIVALSPLPISTNPDGTIHIQGIMNFTPKDSKNIGQLVSLQELRERVDESADLTRQLLEMQSDFAPPTGG